MKTTLFALILALIGSMANAATTTPVQLLSPTNSINGQAIISNGPSTPPTWGDVSAAGLASQAANTVVGNFTGSAARPTAFTMPSCSATGNALRYTSGTGFSCNTTLFSSPTITTPAITGVTNASDAAAGNVGEYLTATTSGTSLTNSVNANCGSISLTAGDWDVVGTVRFNPAATTTTSMIHVSPSTTSATHNTNVGANVQLAATFPAVTQVISAPVTRFNLSSTTTVYLVAGASFSTSTLTCDGFIRARRVR